MGGETTEQQPSSVVPDGPPSPMEAAEHSFLCHSCDREWSAVVPLELAAYRGPSPCPFCEDVLMWDEVPVPPMIDAAALRAYVAELRGRAGKARREWSSLGAYTQGQFREMERAADEMEQRFLGGEGKSG